MADWMTGQVVEKKQWSDGLFSLIFEADLAPFAAGQFVRVGLEVAGETVGRPYSLVNAPDDPRHEIHFNVVPVGQLSEPLAQLEPGDPILVDPRPNGFFTLDEVPDGRRLWMLATGTAIGPYVSILKTAEVWERFESIHLAHGVRLASDLAYREEIEQLAAQYPGRFRFVPMVSREETDFAVPGRVTDAIENGRLEERFGVRLDPALDRIMLCGSMAMIRDVMGILEQRGFRKNRLSAPGQIVTEKYH